MYICTRNAHTHISAKTRCKFHAFIKNINSYRVFLCFISPCQIDLPPELPEYDSYEVFADITNELDDMNGSYSHTAAHHASMQHSQSMSKQTKQSQYYSKQTSYKQTRKRSKKLTVISKQANDPHAYTHTVAKHAHSNLQHNQEQVRQAPFVGCRAHYTQ